jgi:hypothetical protein
MRAGKATAPGRLELHRLSWLKNGRRGPLLAYSVLSEEERDVLQRELAADVRIKSLNFTSPLDDELYASVMLDVLSGWGVMCTHPSYALEREKPGHWECKTCGCAVITGWREALPAAKKSTESVDSGIIASPWRTVSLSTASPASRTC